MSAVLSQNGQSIWLMAWLDELPRSSAEVPRAALLRLLAGAGIDQAARHPLQDRDARDGDERLRHLGGQRTEAGA